MFIWDKSELNEDQEKAILAEEDVLLIACPGSGKTRSIIYKIGHEVSKLEKSKKFVIAITYTNVAADEIKDRAGLLGIDTSKLWIGTIHSFCLEWIIRPYSLYHDDLKFGYTTLNGHEQEEIITRLCEKYQNITYWDCDYFKIPDDYRLKSTEQSKHENIKKVLAEYFSILKAGRQIDFEHILSYSYEILKNNPVIKKNLSNLFSYILLDEYQDTKELQYHIFSFLLNNSEDHMGVFIVGDPNQSIFQGLGGFPMRKDDMEQLFNRKITPYFLNKNYRSSKKLIQFYKNYKTFKSPIIPAGIHKDFPSVITYNNKTEYNSLEDEIARLIQWNLQNDIPSTEICITGPQWYPIAHLTRNLIAKLPDLSFNGPGIAPFSRDIDNFWYKVSRIVLTEPAPNMYIRRLRWSKEILNEIANLGVDISHFSSKLLLRYCNSLTIKEDDGVEYLKVAFMAICKIFQVDINTFPLLLDHHNAFFEGAEKRIKKLRDNGLTDVGNTENFKKVFRQKEGIRVSTIHGVKGEEYDTMIGFGLLDNWVPFFSDTNGRENSIKMLYVLSSRARKNLHLISETGRRKNFHKPKGLLPTPTLADYIYSYDEI